MRTAVAFALCGLALSAGVHARPIAFAPAPPADAALVVPLGSELDLAARAPAIDEGTRNAVVRALRSAKFDYSAGSTLALRGIGNRPQIVIVGTGSEPLTYSKLQDLGGTAAAATLDHDGPVAMMVGGLAGTSDPGVAVATGAAMRSYRFGRYKSVDPAKPRSPGLDAPLVLVGAADGAAARYRRDGAALVEAVAFTRNLATEPANVLYPEEFVERTRAAFRGVPNVTIDVLDVAAMERLGMGSILSVGKGSVRPPRMLIVHYRGAGGAPIALVGKGITFDSGGISLKPGTGMWAMKGDMAGAAAVIGTALSLARSQAPANVVAIAALAENMPGGSATRPGDVVRAMTGKTIEILNTDAEGRLVLADGVALAERRFSPAAIVDIATLTGSVAAALGDEYAGLLTRNDALAAQLIAAGQTSGEELWRLPLHPNYADDMKSDIADIKNVVEGGSPGAGFGGHFIGAFVERTPWAHLDIAGVDWRTKDLPTVPKGSAGFGVRLLDRFVRDFRPVAR